MSDDSILFASQQLLEQNEDIIAAIVENLQIGRIDDSIKHYTLLHKNLVSLALALDNFPGDGIKPYEEIQKFPDEIMRRDVMDELHHSAENITLPTPPPLPPCTACAEQQFTSFKCRVELGHLEPNSNFTVMESQEFLKVAQLLENGSRRYPDENQGSMRPLNSSKSGDSKESDGHFRSSSNEAPSKRIYRVWSSWERYTVCLGIAAYGGIKRDCIAKIQALLEGRTCGQLRSYIAKNLSKDDLQELISGKLPPAPVNYIPPKALLQFNLSSTSSLIAQLKNQEADTNHIKSPYASSQLDPRMSKGKWTTLLGLVEGNGHSHSTCNSEGAKIPPSVLPIQTSTSKYPPLAPLPPPQENLSPEDFPVLDSIATLARGKDSSGPLAETQIPSIPSFRSIAKFTPLPPPVMFASEILGAPPLLSKQRKAPSGSNTPQRTPKKQSADKEGVTPEGRRGRKRQSAKSQKSPAEARSGEEQALVPPSSSPYFPYQPVEEKSDTLDWGMSTWAWGQKQFNSDTNLSSGGDFFHNPSPLLLPDESFEYSNNNPSILRKKSSKKRKSNSNQTEADCVSTNSSPHESHATSGQFLSHPHSMSIHNTQVLPFENSNSLESFPNPENSMLMPIFDEFSMM